MAPAAPAGEEILEFYRGAGCNAGGVGGEGGRGDGSEETRGKMTTAAWNTNSLSQICLNIDLLGSR